MGRVLIHLELITARTLNLNLEVVRFAEICCEIIYAENVFVFTIRRKLWHPKLARKVKDFEKRMSGPKYAVLYFNSKRKAELFKIVNKKNKM